MTYIGCCIHEATIICIGGPNPLVYSQACIDKLNAASRVVDREIEEKQKLRKLNRDCIYRRCEKSIKK